MHRALRTLEHYLLPHESNNYRAKALHPQFLLFYVFLFVAIQSLATIIKTNHPDILGYATDINIDRVLTLVNQERAKEHLQPLTVSKQLTDAAAAKGKDMFSYNYWAHISPTGVTPWVFITAAGYQYLYAGENLAKSFDTSEEVVQAWMNSPTHRANIMKPQYHDIGLAILNGRLNGEETTLVVQEFGTTSDEYLAESKQTPAAGTVTDVQPITAPAVAQADVPAEPPAAPAVMGSTQPSSAMLAGVHLSKKVSMLFVEFLLALLLIDGIVIWRKRVVRVGGHNLAHIIFLVTLLGAMGATGVGAIL
jgi:hypothetical protein